MYCIIPCNQSFVIKSGPVAEFALSRYETASLYLQKCAKALKVQKGHDFNEAFVFISAISTLNCLNKPLMAVHKKPFGDIYLTSSF